jgi:hypothetical protein
MKAFPCRRLDPITLEVIEIIPGRSYQPSRVKFWRRLLALKRAGAAPLVRFSEGPASEDVASHAAH